MKKNNKNIGAIFMALIVGLIIFVSCQSEEQIYPKTRLFRPVLNEELFSIDNTIIVDMGKMKEANKYTIEVSRDTFKTVDYLLEVDTNYVVIDKEMVGEELLWFTIYQVQATAHASSSDFDSKISDLGNVRTQKFPSNQGAPTAFDVTDKRARVFWTAAGAPITGVKVFAITDLRLETPLLEFDVNEDEAASFEKIVTGLSPNTEYQIGIFSGETVRGWEVYSTREALVSGDNVIDLLGIDNPDILADTLPDIAGGSIVLLEGGRTYNTGGYAFDKSVTIRSGYSFTPALPHIDCSSNFNLADGSNVDSLVFKDISFSGDFGGNYIFNIDKSGTIGEIKFETSRIRSLRGVTRVKGGVGTLGKYTVVESVLDSINGYAVLTMDKDSWEVGDILLKNSTISKTQYFLVSRSNTNSITIDGCTINEAPEAGRQMFRWRGSDGNNNVINGIKIHNTIWGHGWDKNANGSFGVDGFDGLGNTNFDIVNTYTTAMFEYAAGKDEIPGFPNFLYNGTSEELWEDPLVGVDFDIKDGSFAGKGDSGDPRWRVGL